MKVKPLQESKSPVARTCTFLDYDLDQWESLDVLLASCVVFFISNSSCLKLLKVLSIFCSFLLFLTKFSCFTWSQHSSLTEFLWTVVDGSSQSGFMSISELFSSTSDLELTEPFCHHSSRLCWLWIFVAPGWGTCCSVWVVLGGTEDP